MAAAPSPMDKLVTLLSVAEDGVFAVALYDRLSVRREMLAALRERVSGQHAVREVFLNERERNPVDLIRALKPAPGDVVCLFDLERALPDALGYLDLQRATLVEMGISLVVWVTTYEHRELANRAPNFYAFRSTILDFTTPAEAELPREEERSFVGRETELALLTGRLTNGGCVVLSGMGGVGKTALAREAARRLHEHFVGGVAWMDCQTRPPLGDIVLTAAVALVGEFVRQLRPDEQRQRLDDALRDRPCLLVLDNFESVAEDGDTLRWLRTIKRPSSALVASRQSVPYLRAPNLSLGEMPPADAVRLFTERARLAGWEGGASDEPAVDELCALVGYLPLALELLAPRAAELPLSALTNLVRENLDALADDKDVTRDERHRSVAACFRLSFDRLSEEAQTLLTRLAVLPDGASEHIIAGFTQIENWHQPIGECVRHSLLTFDGQRYHLHPLVRRFALAQLGDAAEEWQERFVTFFLVDGRHLFGSRIHVFVSERRNLFSAMQECCADIKRKSQQIVKKLSKSKRLSFVEIDNVCMLKEQVERASQDVIHSINLEFEALEALISTKTETDLNQKMLEFERISSDVSNNIYEVGMIIKNLEQQVAESNFKG